MKVTLGGDRLGSGRKMKVDLHGYERSTHNLGYIWRSTMAAGTLVPFLKKLALPGDTWDIDLDCVVMTHPTLGPLFGSAKIQLDVFEAPIRLYNGLLHNNALNIGRYMNVVKLPQIELTVPETNDDVDINQAQVNPSCLLAYLGIRGIGYNGALDGPQSRQFNAIPILAYWEIYKNYYANKQELFGAVLHTPSTAPVTTVTAIEGNNITIAQSPASGGPHLNFAAILEIQFTGAQPNPNEIVVQTSYSGGTAALSMEQLAIDGTFTLTAPGVLQGTYNYNTFGPRTLYQWDYRAVQDPNNGKPAIEIFPLDNIDHMRNQILSSISTTAPFLINDFTTAGGGPYTWLVESPAGYPNILSSQEGLALKTYQSDIFNNWLNEEWIDGVNGINEITAIDTSGGSFTMDAFILSSKVYKMLNRIAVSGGSYDDWMDAVWAHERYKKCESPMYSGGLIKELVFQEVVNNSGSIDQPLGTLAGKGVMAKKHKGGNIIIKVDEPAYIMGNISITPRIDYSQGNHWDTHLQTMDDLHKPALDEIGFEDLILEAMAYWTTYWDDPSQTWIQQAVGKQPAWINYMTAYNETYGNFAVATNEMFMTFNRRYQQHANNKTAIADLTTYIDPSQFNFIFAQTSLDAQNYWTQISVDITARRKMSAKIMPNL